MSDAADRVRAALDDPSVGFPARWAKALEIALEALESIEAGCDLAASGRAEEAIERMAAVLESENVLEGW